MYVSQPRDRNLYVPRFSRSTPCVLLLIGLATIPIALLAGAVTSRLGAVHSLLLLATIVGLAGITLLSLHKTIWGLGAFVILLPISLALHVALRSSGIVNDEFGYLSLNPETILLLVTILAVAIGLLAGRKGLIGTKLDIPIAVFVLASGFSVIGSTNQHHSSRIVFSSVIAVLAYYLIVNTVRTRREFFYSISILLLSFLTIGLYGLRDFHRGSAALDPGSEVLFRVDPLFTNPTFYASVLLLITPLALSLATSSALPARLKAAAGLVGSLLVVSLVLTLTRGAWLGFVAAILVVLLFHRQARKIVLISLPVVAIVVAMTNGFWVDLFLTRTDSVDRLLQSDPWVGRVNAWDAATDMIQDSPITGIGPGMFLTSYPEYEPARFYLRLSDAHNLFLHLGAEQGVIAAAALAGIFGIDLWIGYRVVRRSKDQLIRDSSLGLIAGLVGFLVYSIATGDILVKYSIRDNGLYFFNGHSIYLFISQGLIIALDKISALENQETSADQSSVSSPTRSPILQW